MTVFVISLGIACGHDGAPSPSSPSPTSLAATSSASLLNTAVATTPGLASNRTSSEKSEEVEGVIAALDNTARSIVVRGITVSVPATAAIRHGHTMLTFADLKVGERVHVRGTRSGATVVASEIVVQDDDLEGEVVLRGVVSSLAGTCPAVTFTIAGAKISTTAATHFTDGTCAEIANGVTAHVRGTRQSDGSIAADRVFFEDADEEHARVKGTVSGLQGACPNLTFSVGTTKVTTDASTRFSGGSCATLANGARVHVTGTAQADGILTAARVRIEKPDTDDEHERDHMEGTVSGLQGTCPALTFSVGTLKVSTNAATEFRGGTCSQLANGVEVEVTGMTQTDGSVSATRVTFDNDESR